MVIAAAAAAAAVADAVAVVTATTTAFLGRRNGVVEDVIDEDAAIQSPHPRRQPPPPKFDDRMDGQNDVIKLDGRLQRTTRRVTIPAVAVGERVSELDGRASGNIEPSRAGLGRSIVLYRFFLVSPTSIVFCSAAHEISILDA